MHRPILLALIAINLVLILVMTKASFFQLASPLPLAESSSSYPELNQIDNKNLNFDQLSKFFKQLAQHRGAEYAFGALKIAKVPKNTDMHLMGHVVGDELYKQQGMDGIRLCTEDFRNACSHSIVVGLLIDKGEEALSQISSACQKAPGGKGAYTMCYHGLGHGVLAYSRYDFSRAIKLCQKTGTEAYQNQEFGQCVGGAVMELISGGGHDRETWSKQRAKSLDPKFPLAICEQAFMPEVARGFCYTYITPYLWEAAGADMGHPTEADFAKAFLLCNQISDSDQIQYKKLCYASFGKDFLGLAMDRDIRDVSKMSDSQFKKIIGWCNLSDWAEGQTECLMSALSSLYWGGENNRQASIKFCNLMPEKNSQTNCFNSLTGLVKAYVDDQKYYHEYCQEIPPQFQAKCQQKLL